MKCDGRRKDIDITPIAPRENGMIESWRFEAVQQHPILTVRERIVTLHQGRIGAS